MSELIYDPPLTTEECTTEPMHSLAPDPRLVSAAALWLRWLLETAPTAEADAVEQAGD